MNREMNSDTSGHHFHHADRHSQRPTANAGQYSCLMHPEVVSGKPGNCPKCGMTLQLMMSRPSETKTIYTCPMHPEIEQDHPGQCPKCGMTLEPKTVGGLDEQEQRAIRSLLDFVYFSLILRFVSSGFQPVSSVISTTMLGFLSCGCTDERSRSCQNGQTVTYFLFVFH
jgi:uncharacterized paraquat-inducible protein A